MWASSHSSMSPSLSQAVVIGMYWWSYLCRDIVHILGKCHLIICCEGILPEQEKFCLLSGWWAVLWSVINQNNLIVNHLFHDILTFYNSSDGPWLFHFYNSPLEYIVLTHSCYLTHPAWLSFWRRLISCCLSLTARSRLGWLSALHVTPRDRWKCSWTVLKVNKNTLWTSVHSCVGIFQLL